MSTGTTPIPLTIEYVGDLRVRVNQANAVNDFRLQIVAAYLGGFPVPLPSGNRIPTWQEAKAAWDAFWAATTQLAQEIFGREVPPPQQQPGQQQPGQQPGMPGMQSYA